MDIPAHDFEQDPSRPDGSTGIKRIDSRYLSCFDDASARSLYASSRLTT
uniref:Uncharacterized protein n=1 Tax=Moniliophthora roreri TaxID=221103 RepID=A0A0W0EU36_MONRR